MTFLLLNAANIALAASSLWIHFRNPTLLDDQGLVYSILAGCLMASLSAIFLGVALLFSAEARWKTNAFHLLLILACSGIQGYLLWSTGKDLGILQMLKSRLG